MNFIKNLFKPQEKINMLLLLMSLEEELLKQSNSNITPSLVSLDDYADIVKESISLELECNRLKELGLTETKNYKLLNQKYLSLRSKIDEVEEINKNKQEDSRKATDLIEFVRLMKKVFGKKSTLISYEKFDELCKKYNLVSGSISDYQGVIPENNLKDIEKFTNTYNHVKNIDYSAKISERDILKLATSIGIKSYGTYNYLLEKEAIPSFRTVTKITDESVKGKYEDVGKRIKEYVKKNGFLIGIYKIKKKYKGYEYLTDFEVYEEYKLESVICDDILKDVTDYKPIRRIYDLRVEGKYEKVPLRIAAKEGDFKKSKSIKISHEPKDPVVFVNSPFGVVVISAWGEESEDQILKHYMEVNNLISK